MSAAKLLSVAGPGDPHQLSRMKEALDLARRGLGRTSPNPAVGAILVKDGRVIGRGYHERAGRDHAEVAALREVGFSAPGADLYTTLEPCNHHGRTGPCTEAILEAGIRRVFVGAGDPNPKVAGAGIARLRAAGVEVIIGVLEDECTRLNEAYNLAIVERRPFVVLKAAMSLDGRIATRKGESRYLTDEPARRLVHEMRDQLDAILVGVGTVIADDPELTARIEGGRNPLRVVLDSKLRLPTDATLVKGAREVPTTVITTKSASVDRRRRLEKKGVEVIAVKKGKGGRVDLRAALEVLHEKELSSVLVEGGSSVHGAFVDEKLVDKLVLFYAPMIIGGDDAPGPVGGRGAGRLDRALRLANVRSEAIGRDFVVTAYPDREA